MNKITTPYKSFSKYILRTPLLSFNFFEDLTSEEYLSDNKLRIILEDPVILEAIFLASPELYGELEKWLSFEMKDEKKIEKLKISLLKYLSRMSTRSTPFGLFAGCSVGYFSEQTDINLLGGNQNGRHTKLDMNYLVALSQDLAKRPNIKNNILFYTNSSLYKIGNKFRYIEYQYVKGKRQHQISAVDASDYLTIVLDMAKSGAYLVQLIPALVSSTVTEEEAADFIDELVESQLLVSELEPSVSGTNFLDQICGVLERLPDADDILFCLKQIDDKISKLDSRIGNNPEMYFEIISLIDQLGTDYDIKYLFQTDMVLNSKTNSIDKAIIDDVIAGIAVLNKISPGGLNGNIDDFAKRFSRRFEDEEVSLSKALDTEFGISYLQNNTSDDFNPLIDDLIIPAKTNSSQNFLGEKLNAVYEQKLTGAHENILTKIILEDQDFTAVPTKWEDLPDTMSFMVELINEDGITKIKLNGGGGPSAARLLTRFCHADPDILKFSSEISDMEDILAKDAILAEVLHLPEARIGNVIMRPDLRKYEIPYLSKSIKDDEFQIGLDDLYIKIGHTNEVILKSKKHDKKVIPRLTNAHNYSYNSLPVYHFLCDMQMHGSRESLYIDTNTSPLKLFTPRLEYKNIILQNASWNLKRKHIENLIKSKGDNATLLQSITKFKETFKIPKFALLIEHDRELLINFDNLTSVHMFLNTVEKSANFKLTEFLHSKEHIAKNSDMGHCSQFIFCFYNEEKLNNLNTI